MFNPIRGYNPAAQSPSRGEESGHDLEATYRNVKHYIDHGMKPDSSFGRQDFDAMPRLVEWANKHYPGVALRYASTPYELAEQLRDTVKKGESSTRFVCNLSSNEMHMCAFDYKLTKGKPSLIGLEPGSANSNGPAMMAFRMKLALDEHVPDAKFAMLETNQQSSEHDCGMFSLDFAVKMQKSIAAFERLHERNCDDALPGKDDFGTVPYREVDKLLPPIFMKHVQSNRRLAEMTNARPELKTEAVNKRDGTLVQRVQRHGVERETDSGQVRTQNESIMRQREKYMRRALNLE